MPSVHGVSHIVLMCRDVEKMQDFYCNTLGFKLSHGNPSRQAFITSDPEREDHEIALFKGRDERENNLVNHIALHVDTVNGVLDFYKLFNQMGVKIDHCTSHGNTVSCYFFDPEGNKLEVYALVKTAPGEGYNGDLDLTKSADEILALYKQKRPAGVH